MQVICAAIVLSEISRKYLIDSQERANHIKHARCLPLAFSTDVLCTHFNILGQSLNLEIEEIVSSPDMVFALVQSPIHGCVNYIVISTKDCLSPIYDHKEIDSLRMSGSGFVKPIRGVLEGKVGMLVKYKGHNPVWVFDSHKLVEMSNSDPDPSWEGDVRDAHTHLPYPSLIHQIMAPPLDTDMAYDPTRVYVRENTAEPTTEPTAGSIAGSSIESIAGSSIESIAGFSIEPIAGSTTEPIDRSTDRSIAEPIAEPIDRSTDRSTDRPTYW